MKLLVFLLLTVVAVVSGLKQCQLTSECASDECCRIEMGAKATIKPEEMMGVCDKYLTKGSRCGEVDVTKGEGCECAPGLECRFTWGDDTLGRRRRQKISTLDIPETRCVPK